MPLALRADTINETFSLTIPATTLTAAVGRFSTTSFAEFNPADGTLNSVAVTLTGSATWSGPKVFLVFLVLHNTEEQVVPGQDFSTPGPINISMSGTDAFGVDLPFLTGTGTTVFDLILEGPGDTFATTSSGGLAGTLTYNYTPAAPTPTPESSTLVQLVPTLLGVLAFGWWMERRKLRAIAR